MRSQFAKLRVIRRLPRGTLSQTRRGGSHYNRLEIAIQWVLVRAGCRIVGDVTYRGPEQRIRTMLRSHPRRPVPITAMKIAEGATVKWQACQLESGSKPKLTPTCVCSALHFLPEVQR